MKPSPKKPQKQNHFFILIAPALVCAAMYGRTVFFDFINLGDTDFITDNPHIRNGLTLDSLRWAFKPHETGWVPIVWISHMLDAQLFGLQAAMHHAINIVLYAIASTLVFFVLHRFTGARWPSAFAALLFAVVGCGAVAWISQRGILLGLIFGLLSLLVREGSAAMYALFICAMLSSPAMIVFPFVHLFLRRGSLRSIAPMFLAALLLGFVRDPFYWWKPLGAVGFLTTSGVVWIAAIGIGIFLPRLSKAAALAVSAVVLIASAAAVWIELGYWQNSMTLFQHALERNPANYAALDRLGDSLRRDGHLPEAIANLEAALKLRPDDPRIRRDFGNALSAAERTREAIPYLKAPMDLAVAYERAEQFHDAELEYREALKLDPSLADARAGIGFMLAQQGRMADAKPFIESSVAGLADAVRLLPDDPYAHMNLGRAYNFLGRSDDAIAELSTATHLHPDEPEPHFQLGLALEQRGRYAEAFAQLGPAEGLAPDSPKIHFRLAETLFQLGRRMEALAHLEQTLKVRPDYPGGREAYQMVHRVIFGN